MVFGQRSKLIQEQDVAISSFSRDHATEGLSLQHEAHPQGRTPWVLSHSFWCSRHHQHHTYESEASTTKAEENGTLTEYFLENDNICY